MKKSAFQSRSPEKVQQSEELAEQIAEFEARNGKVKTSAIKPAATKTTPVFTIQSAKQDWKAGRVK